MMIERALIRNVTHTSDLLLTYRNWRHKLGHASYI